MLNTCTMCEQCDPDGGNLLERLDFSTFCFYKVKVLVVLSLRKSQVSSKLVVLEFLICLFVFLLFS